MIGFIPLLVCIIGLIVYALSNNGKVQQLALYAFGCGLLVTLFNFANLRL